jgi:hypothetical protein
MLKGILRDRDFNLNDEIEEGIASVWNNLTFDEVYSYICKWISHFARVFKNGREHALE